MEWLGVRTIRIRFGYESLDVTLAYQKGKSTESKGAQDMLVKRGTYVEEGMRIGFVTDYFGKLILEARAPISGVILHINAVPSLKKGDNIADIGAIAAHAP